MRGGVQADKMDEDGGNRSGNMLKHHHKPPPLPRPSECFMLHFLFFCALRPFIDANSHFVVKHFGLVLLWCFHRASYNKITPSDTRPVVPNLVCLCLAINP